MGKLNDVLKNGRKEEVAWNIRKSDRRESQNIENFVIKTGEKIGIFIEPFLCDFCSPKNGLS